MVVALVLHLLRLGQEGLDLAEIEQRVPLIGLLDDPGDDVTLAAGVLVVLHLAFGFTDPLQDHLLGGLRRDTPEVLRRVVPFLDDVTVFVELLRDHMDLAGLDVDLDERLVRGVGHPLICGDQRICQRLEHDLDGNALFALDRVERFHHV